MFNRAKTTSQKGKRETKDIPIKLGEVSNKKGIAAKRFWTEGENIGLSE